MPLYKVKPFIEQQLAKWTKEGMSKRIELAIGATRSSSQSRARSERLVGLLIHLVSTGF